jgi:hypothetical protein
LGRIVLDIDDTFDAVHGHQQLHLFNSYYDEYGFQPIVVFDGEGRLVGTLLRPARRPKGAESVAHIRRLIRQIRAHWPKTEILLRADSHYCTPEVLDLCDRLGLRYVLGLSKNGRLTQTISALEASTAARYACTPGQKLRRFKTFSYAARSWSKPRRVIARVEDKPQRARQRRKPASSSLCRHRVRNEGFFTFSSTPSRHRKQPDASAPTTPKHKPIRPKTNAPTGLPTGCRRRIARDQPEPRETAPP